MKKQTNLCKLIPVVAVTSTIALVLLILLLTGVINLPRVPAGRPESIPQSRSNHTDISYTWYSDGRCKAYVSGSVRQQFNVSESVCVEEWEKPAVAPQEGDHIIFRNNTFHNIPSVPPNSIIDNVIGGSAGCITSCGGVK